MSLYHEAAAILSGPSTHGGSLKSRIYSNKELKSPPAQVYALAFESSKWSEILREVVENSQLLQTERKLTPALSILLVHDLLLAKKGIALPPSHGLRVAVEKHRARLQSEFTRARVRRKCATLDALKALVDAQLGPVHPRWIRVNTVKTTVDEQLDTTFKGFEVVQTVDEVIASASTGKKVLCLDGHVPNLVAASPAVDFTRTEAYRSGALILQDKASCFPAYLLDPRPEDGDIIDACSAPGNKTTHLAAILHERGFAPGQRIHAFEKDPQRARTLEKMVSAAGAAGATVIHAGRDFLKTDPHAPEFRSVGALLLDPSCSGSGIVGRDDAPAFHLPSLPAAAGAASSTGRPQTLGKRKRPEKKTSSSVANTPSSKSRATTTMTTTTTPTITKTTTTTTPAAADPDADADSNSNSNLNRDTTTKEKTRLAALAAFQLSIILHAFAFPAARRVTYSTCSVHAAENERVVGAALASAVARHRGWRVLRRGEQVRGMAAWPVRGLRRAEVDADADARVDAGGGEGSYAGEEEEEEEEEEEDGKGTRSWGEDDAEGCVRANKGDGRGTMGFFVVCFVRDRATPAAAAAAAAASGGGGGSGIKRENGGKTGGDADDDDDDDDGPYVRDEQGRIIRDENGIPTLKSTGRKAIEVLEETEEDDGSVELRFGEGGSEVDDGDGPFQRDAEGRIIRGPDGMPVLKARAEAVGSGEAEVFENGEAGDNLDEAEDVEGDEVEYGEDDLGEDEWGGFDD